MALVRMSMPADLADSLINQQVAVRPPKTRGPADDLVQMVIDGVNTGASVVTVVMAAAAMRKFAERLWERMRRSEKDVVTVTITVGTNAPRELKVQTDDAAGTDKVLDFLIDALPARRR